MPEPLPTGTKVALSLEAGGHALPFAEAEVVWNRPDAPEAGTPGFGVRFERFLHPRAQELVAYLCDNLERGRPLRLAPNPHPVRRAMLLTALALFGTSSVGWLWVLTADPFPAPSLASGGVLPITLAPSTAVAPEPEPTSALPPPRGDEKRGSIRLPSGEARSIDWAIADREVRLSAATKAGTLKHTFMLADPARVIFDLEGEAPDQTHTLSAIKELPFIKHVRVGRQGGATRVVIDLTSWPRDVTEDGDAWVLRF
jgi:AMIN domain